MISILLVTIILSFIPISELRGGMIYAIANGMNPYSAFLICVVANILGVLFAFFFLDFLHKEFMKIGFYKKAFDKYMEKTRKKADDIEKKMGNYGFLALAIFVAIPIPATGGLTGALIAWYLGLDRKKSLASISLGVLAAGILILLVSLGLIKLF